MGICAEDGCSAAASDRAGEGDFLSLCIKIDSSVDLIAYTLEHL